MKMLLDTHAFLWFIEDGPNLSIGAQRSDEIGFGWTE